MKSVSRKENSVGSNFAQKSQWQGFCYKLVLPATT